MGRSSSKLIQTPNSPLQELQCQELKRARQKRKQEKEQKQIAKLQKKHAKRQQKKGKKLGRSGSEQSQTASGSGGGIGGGIATISGAGGDQRSSGDPMSSLASCQNLRSEVNREELNRVVAQKIQHNLNGNLCAFALNQIAIGQQFCGNYESEMLTISEDLLERENLLNHQLDEQSILLVNPLDAAVAKWFHYRPLHGPDKERSQLLQNPVMYVVFENVDIARANDANYDSISPLCRVDMETEFYQTTPCKEDYVEMLRDIKWKGYVRLKLRETPKVPKPSDGEGKKNSNGENGIAYEELYTDLSSGYSSTGGYSSGTRPASTSSLGGGSGRDGSDPIYDYAYIAHLNRQHPLSELKMSSQREKAQLDAKVLPESCVSSLASCVDAWNVEDSDEENDDDDEDSSDDEASSTAEDEEEEGHIKEPPKSRNRQRFVPGKRDEETVRALRLHKQEQERRRALLQQRYLNSREFMRYFGELMRLKLAEPLGVPPGELETSSYRGSSIYTQQYEIIPAIHVAQNAHHWPDCAFQFRIRERPSFMHPRTGQQLQWPTRAMIKRIESFGFHVVPTGFAPKRTRNPFYELEWRICFPKAERYLERHLTGAQVKVFLMAKALVKAFVEPTEAGKGLTFVLDHLRTHLFWECERNYAAWPEEFLGEVLVRFIESFMARLREKRLADYFVEERNLFESIPEYSLVTLYSILADITHNPLPHVMVACRHMHPNEAMPLVFPKLNFRKLFDCLSENDMMPLRALSKQTRSNLLDAAELAAEEEPPGLLVDDGAKGLVGLRQHREKTHGKLRRKTHLMRHSIEVKKQQDMEMRRRSVESINVEFFFGNDLNADVRHLNQGVENLRRTNLLEIFLDHLLAVCEWTLQMQTMHQADICLEQARRLCTLYNNYGCDMGAKDYQIVINGLAEELDVLQKSGVSAAFMSPPMLPVRPSVETSRSSPLQLVRELAERRAAAAAAAAAEEARRTSAISLALPDAATLLPVPPGMSSDCESIYADGMELAIAECDHRLAKVREDETPIEADTDSDSDGSAQDLNTPAEPRKSIKFTEHVVEVHEGDTNPNHKPIVSSPVSILRPTTGPELAEGATNQEEETAEAPKKVDQHPPGFKEQAKTAAEQLSNVLAARIDRSKVLKSLSSSTEKLMARVNEDERCSQLREMLKQKTLKLRDVLHHASANT